MDSQELLRQALNLLDRFADYLEHGLYLRPSPQIAEIREMLCEKQILSDEAFRSTAQMALLPIEAEMLEPS